MWNIINNYLKSIAIIFGYNILYIFSYFQIKYNYLHNKLICDMKHDKVLHVELYNEMNEMNEIKNKKMSDYLYWKNECYDCMIIMKDVGIYPYDKLIIKKYSNFPVELNWNYVKYKFLSLIVIISENETYDIKLNNKKENYYIVGNVIDEYFIKYYLLKYHKIKITPDISYSLQLIDQNVKINILDMSKKITLLENEYVIN
jgi:hypothetical protein